jgi:hypothetical protein
MQKVRWASSGFKISKGSREKCPAMAGNQAGRRGSDGKREGCIVGCSFLWDHVLHITWRLVWTTIFLTHIWAGFGGARTLQMVGSWRACKAPV